MTDTPETMPEVPESTAAAPSATTKRNVLGTKQIVALWGWCERNRDSLATTQNPKLAAIAQAELEFPVTPANIANMLEEMGIEKRRPDAPPTMEEQVMRLADAWRNQEERTAGLLSTLQLVTERLNRLERLHDDNTPFVAADPAQPELTGLPLGCQFAIPSTAGDAE